MSTPSPYDGAWFSWGFVSGFLACLLMVIATINRFFPPKR